MTAPDERDVNVPLDPSRLGDTLDALREGVQVLSPDWRYLYVNEAVAQHGKRSREDLLGKSMLECYPGIDATPMFATLERCMRERRADEMENEFIYPDGERAWFELRVRPCAEGLIVLSVDITERKRLESSLRQAHKLRALGQMAVGVAHDLKNLLNPLGLQITLLKRRVGTDPRVSDVLESMSNTVTRGAQTIDLLRDFSRQAPESAVSAATDPNTICREAVALTHPRAAQLPCRIDVQLAPDEVLPISVSGGELLSAVVNLIVNAIDAMPDGGRITVRTGLSENAVWLEVADDGVGMPPDVRARAFEPFFTTKGEQGTGMGLSMVYAFTSRSGGTARIDSEHGAGTTVRLSFPAAKGAPPVEALAATSGRERSGR